MYLPTNSKIVHIGSLFKYLKVRKVRKVSAQQNNYKTDQSIVPEISVV